ncbi:MAG: helix-turn-helix transcriptional regulator [Sedimentitalea sp.]|nr:helix-turn-helix transcriptional regulator [Sedimentitalea sp.]
MGAAHTSVVVPCAVLGHPCPVDPDVSSGEGLASLRGEAGLAAAAMIREIVKTYLRDRPLRVAELAEILGTSERSLQRHLAALDLSFAQLDAEARYQVACEMLARADLQVADVAFATGYENPSHFTRAFRRVAGVPPSAYRRSLQPAP